MFLAEIADAREFSSERTTHRACSKKDLEYYAPPPNYLKWKRRERTYIYGVTTNSRTPET
tara:strand:+ start:295 stop:474 length:180 start_codon:yes stop_codon:yes gene_type:complete